MVTLLLQNPWQTTGTSKFFLTENSKEGAIYHYDETTFSLVPSYWAFPIAVGRGLQRPGNHQQTPGLLLAVHLAILRSLDQRGSVGLVLHCNYTPPCEPLIESLHLPLPKPLVIPAVTTPTLGGLTWWSIGWSLPWAIPPVMLVALSANKITVHEAIYMPSYLQLQIVHCAWRFLDLMKSCLVFWARLASTTFRWKEWTIEQTESLSPVEYARLGTMIQGSIQLRALYIDRPCDDGAYQLLDGINTAVNLRTLSLREPNVGQGNSRQAPELLVGDNGPLIRLSQNPLLPVVCQLKELSI